MHDLVFSAASKFDHLHSAWTPCHPALSDAAKAFGQNISRVHTLVAVPSVLLLSNFPDDLEKLKGEYPQASWLDNSSIHYGSGCVTDLLSKGLPALHAGIHAILAAQVIGAWTAFESLAIDAWEQAINECPEVLVDAFGINARDKTKDRDVDVPLTAAAILRSRFDRSARLGTMLSEHWLKSTTRDGIVRAYKTVFGGRPAIIGAVASGDILALEALRNLFAHRAGVVDQRFLDKIGKHAELSKYNPGEQIALTGTVTAELTQAAITSGKTLLNELTDLMLDPDMLFCFE